MLLQEMKATAAALGARWDVVLQADAAAPESADWRRLRQHDRQMVLHGMRLFVPK